MAIPAVIGAYLVLVSPQLIFSVLKTRFACPALPRDANPLMHGGIGGGIHHVVNDRTGIRQTVSD
jgi:hypothetical protein